MLSYTTFAFYSKLMQLAHIFGALLLLINFSAVSASIVPNKNVGTIAPIDHDHIKMTAVPGFFAQSSPNIDAETWDFAARNFGILTGHGEEGPVDASGISAAWASFKSNIEALNRDSPVGTSYKVLYLARHGQGVHNAAENYYGMEGWECYWAMQSGNGTSSWGPDAELTEKGRGEVRATHRAWLKQLGLGAPGPMSHYVSPLRRSVETMMVTWEGVNIGVGGDEEVYPMVKELLRETLSLHTGDARSPKSVLQKTFPQLTFSPSFPELDPLWNYARESHYLRDLRIKSTLEEILRTDKNTFIAITSHFGTTQSALRVLGHRAFDMKTASMIPVVIRVERVAKGRTEPSWEEVYRTSLEESDEAEYRSVCEGYPEVLVQGGYSVPGGMGM